MDSIAGYAQDRTLWEKLSQNVQPTLGNDPGEAYARGGVQPEAFVYHNFEIRKAFGNFRGCDRIIFVSEDFVEFSLELGLNRGILGEMVGNSAQSTTKRVVSVNSGEDIEDGRHLTWMWYLSQRPAE